MVRAYTLGDRLGPARDEFSVDGGHNPSARSLRPLQIVAERKGHHDALRRPGRHRRVRLAVLVGHQVVCLCA